MLRATDEFSRPVDHWSQGNDTVKDLVGKTGHDKKGNK